MKSFLTSVLGALTRAWKSFVGWGSRMGWGKVTLGAAVLLLVFIGVRSFVFNRSAEATTSENIRQVMLASVAQLSNGGSPLQIVGTVSSVSQATVNAQSSGAVTSINYSLGDYVSAGAIVAELEDAAQRAAVLQAQGSVDAAQAALNKVSGPSGESAKTTAVNTLLSAYSAVDSAIRGTADTMLSNPDSTNPQFIVSTSNSQLPISISNMRIALGPVWARETARSKNLNVNDDLAGELVKTIDDVRATRTFIDTILQALNTGIPNQNVSQATITADITAATAARTALNSALSSLASAQTSLENGASSGGADLASAQATLKQAQGALAAARANLEKSIIRAPISGTINAFSLKRGDFVGLNQAVLTVANNGALEIVAYLTQQDAQSVAIGSSVDIEGGAKGVVTRLAPALDPVTKKLEVHIGVRSGTLTNGQSVLVNFAHKTATPGKAPARIAVPINAIKIGASETVVFTIDMASSTATSSRGVLMSHPVTLGELLGDSVVISQGLTPDMRIVTDARGLRAGEEVEVKSDIQ